MDTDKTEQKNDQGQNGDVVVKPDPIAATSKTQED